MARDGDTLDNPVTGQRIVFRKTATETGGELLEMEFRLRSGGYVAAEHVHPEQEERFEVVEGRPVFRVGGKEIGAGPGDVLVVSPGVPHVWWNPRTDPSTVLVSLRPALRSEVFFETLFGLARDGKTDARGVPHLLQLAVMGPAFDREGRLQSIPRPLQRLMFAFLGPLGRRRGYRPWYPRYSPDAGPPG